MKTYQFEGRDVRVSHENGEVWFVAADICAVLGLKNPSNALEKLSVVDRGSTSVPTKLGSRQVLTLNEHGFMQLTYSSRKPYAKPLQRWALKEVLTPQEPPTPKAQPQPELRLSAPSAIFDKENRATLKALEKRCKAAVSAKARRGLDGPWRERPQGLTEDEVEAFMTTVDLYIENVFQLIRMEDLGGPETRP